MRTTREAEHAPAGALRQQPDDGDLPTSAGAGRVHRAVAAAEHWRRFVYCTGMARGVELGRVDHFDDGTHDGTHHDDDDDRHHREVSPASVAHFGKYRLVPELLQRAYALHPRGRDGFITGATHRRRDPFPNREGASEGAGKGRVTARLALADPTAPTIQTTRRYRRRRRPRRRGWGQLARPRLVTGANDGYTRDAAPGERALHVPNAARLRRDNRAAMLYFVFNPDVVAVVVAHDLRNGEFVAQTPLSPHQSLERDFSRRQCAALLEAAANGGTNGGTSARWTTWRCGAFARGRCPRRWRIGS